MAGGGRRRGDESGEAALTASESSRAGVVSSEAQLPAAGDSGRSIRLGRATWIAVALSLCSASCCASGSSVALRSTPTRPSSGSWRARSSTGTSSPSTGDKATVAASPTSSRPCSPLFGESRLALGLAPILLDASPRCSSGASADGCSILAWPCSRRCSSGSGRRSTSTCPPSSTGSALWRSSAGWRVLLFALRLAETARVASRRLGGARALPRSRLVVLAGDRLLRRSRPALGRLPDDPRVARGHDRPAWSCSRP